MARFFIDRPIFAWVISIVIVLAGLAAVFFLPVAQYPEITPPTVQVTCQYAGASATVVAETVAAPIEQQVNGVEDMLYMSSQSTNDGTYTLTVTFKLGTSLDMAQVLVQNRVAQATPTLPDVVKATGVTVKKRSPSILLVVNLFSETDPQTGKPLHDQLDLSNFATIQIKDELARIEGVGDVTVLGQQDYSMRIWLDPNRLASRNLTAGDIVKALREQNVQVAAGRLGQPPVPNGLDFQYTMTALGRLRDPSQFEDIVVKSGSEGETTRLRDVATVDLGSRNQDTACRLDGRASVGLALFQQPGTNALDTADRIEVKMQYLKANRFRKGIDYAVVYDTTPFVRESVNEVFKTLRDAVFLVALVVLIFLQDWRSVVLPLIDVTVSLVGTFAVMYLMGFTLNNLTLFGLVLAIGIVVDDAIVVLENIERWLAKGLPVREATITAMHEITGPIIAITLVLCAVFLPSAFITGISGQFYRQFALTIAASMLLSATNAMTMTPARAAAIFKHRRVSATGHIEGHEALPWWGVAVLGGWLAVAALEPWVRTVLRLPAEPAWKAWGVHAAFIVPAAVAGYWLTRPVNAVLGFVFRGFNRVFDWVTRAYGRLVAGALRVSFLVLVVYGGLLGLTYFGLTRVPTGFIPAQDKGYMLVNIQLPDAASLERTSAVVQHVEQIAHEIPGVAHTVSIPGQSFVLNAISSNFASMFVIFDPFHERHADSESGNAIAAQLRVRVAKDVEEAQVAVFGPPAVEGLGNAGGFKLMVEDLKDVSLDVLQGQADNLAEKANLQQGIVGVINTFRADTPQMYVDINRSKCKMMGVALNDVFDTLQFYLGGYYVNDFNLFGRTWQVNVQAEAPYRMTADAVKQLRVRGQNDQMVPLGTLAEIRDSSGPVMVSRYNMHPAAALNGASLPTLSSGQVIHTMESLADENLAASMGYEWTELTYLEKLAGSTAIFAFLGAVVLVFLVLAAQYESWSLPLAVILVVPMCVLSGVAGVALARMDVNIFVQVGFIVLVGLASKNAILVVEFARDALHAEGVSVFDATIAACKARLRPIVMTSVAFILGVVPLVLATGAGAEMRRTLGVAVFSGMIGVTLFGLLLTPVFFYVIERLVLGERGRKVSKAPAASAPAQPVLVESAPHH
ncbi:MAG TPA: efflux RND transporter permease subunit [Pirellulales bacterium]|jgi:multidrug efflux pump|nr:efflux RND transporter permease subunit [Pirellulales bacterium]